MSRALDDLAPEFKPIAIQLLARLCEAGIPVMIVDTLRTEAEHALNLANGVSWTDRSKHLTGHAIDIVPYSLYTLAPGGDKLQWDAHDPVWQRVGKIGKALGLRWGGDFKPPARPDCGHFEV